MKKTRVTINALFAGYARAGLDAKQWYEDLTEEQRLRAQLEFIEVRATLLARMPHDNNAGVPANVQNEASRLNHLVQQAIEALRHDKAIQVGGFMLNIGATLQSINTHLTVAVALDVTKELEENEENIHRGRKVLEGAQKSAQQRNAPFLEKRAQYQPCIEELFRNNPKLSYADLQRIAAKKFGVSKDTIKNHTENPKNNQQK